MPIMIHVYNELKIVIKDTLKAIDLSYNNNKIALEDYDEMTSAIENINSYFLSMYGKYTDFDEEVKYMVKSFYDPKVEERGIEKGKIEIASEMIKEGEPMERIKKYTKLDENKILELMKRIESEKVQ
ncbi:hypothetical protein Ccar_03825 [Clostridium carboxidivorans P7]|uniref:Uncharacterized protein n=1 Tax=Clostridium carboxidivorans P7 TaxID=536227 RepID=C6Q224_9CLOT|nr:hypothetical protein [Clostridium carboxidivorans]AKN30001.1 hypothetical protein Ccar_03825 [Clostridium carboxidivorans P7]EET84453.1 conserved hypothetical protein [Clostridium carboxidivorans P7]